MVFGCFTIFVSDNHSIKKIRIFQRNTWNAIDYRANHLPWLL